MADNKDTQYQGTNAHSSSDNASNSASNSNTSNTQGAENTNTNAFGYTPFANFPFGNNAFGFGSNPFNNFGTNAFNLPQNPLDFLSKTNPFAHMASSIPPYNLRLVNSIANSLAI